MDPVKHTNLSKLFEVLHKPNVHRFFKYVHQATTVGLSIAFVFAPQAEGLLAVTSLFRDDSNYEEIMRNFQKINDILNKIQYRLETSAVTGRWNHIKSVLSPSIHTLEESIQFYHNASLSDNEKNTANWIKELLARKESICSSFDKLLIGLAENREFNENVWEPYYDFVRGDRHKVENFCKNMLFLMLFGFSVACLTLTLSNDIEWCEEYAEKLNWMDKIKKAIDAMNCCVEKCKTEYDKNIAIDVSGILRTSRQDLEPQLERLFNKKYKWLQAFWIVYHCNSSEMKYLSSEKHLVLKSHNADKIDGVAFDGADVEDDEEEEEEEDDNDDEKDEGGDNDEECTNAFDETNEPVVNKLAGKEEDREIAFDSVDFSSFNNKPNCVVLCAFVKEKPTGIPVAVSDAEYFKTYNAAQKIIEASIKKFRSSRKNLKRIKEGLETEGINYWGLVVLSHWNPLKNNLSKIIHHSSFINHNNLLKVTVKSYTVYLLLDGSQ